MSGIYWEQMLRSECAYVSICTTKTCLLVFPSISNHNGVALYCHFLSAHHSCYKTAHPEGLSFGSEVLTDHFPGNGTRRPDSGTSGKVEPSRNPSGVHHLRTAFAHFSEILKQQVLRLMATENLPSTNMGKKI